LAVLEITTPRGLLAPFYRLWFDGVVPLLGKVLPGGSAYAYLPASVRRFPGPEELAALLGEAGVESVRFRLLAGGIVAPQVGEASCRGWRRSARRPGSRRTSASSRPGSTRRCAATRASSPPRAPTRSRAASGCGRCSSSSPPRRSTSRRSRRASR